ncbi:MAG TPA: SDR family oxidoreductase [Roseiarcus sp.]|nr:SDR family oxidoreductase [Roseiarcus sp.]
MTGGAGSIGMAAAKLFLSEGAKLTLVDVNQAALDRARDALSGESVMLIKGDVTKVESVEAALYLASDQSSFTTGTLLMVDGGMSA